MRMEEKKEFTFAERIMLQHAYAPKLISDCLGIGLGIYFLWQNTLWAALLALFGLSILGNVIAWKQDIRQLAQTPLGKWMLVQANPVNLVVRTIGAAVLAYGVWLHAPIVILAGVGVIFLARLLSAGAK